MLTPARRFAALAVGLLLAVLAQPMPTRAESALPARDLIVELRETDAAGAATGWDVASADAARNRVAQQVRVRNGHSANLRLSITRPVQTWQAVPSLWGVAAVPATEWIAAGQALVVQPRWPGGARPVAVTLRAQLARFDASVAPGSSALPERHEAGLETTVEMPLGAWVVIATSGATDAAPGRDIGTREAASRGLQLRVSLAP